MGIKPVVIPSSPSAPHPNTPSVPQRRIGRGTPDAEGGTLHHSAARLQSSSSLST